MKNKTYISILLTSFVLFIVISFLIDFISRKVSPDEILLEHQIQKIKKNHTIVQNIFIGDSTLGHGIDASIIEKITGKKTLNLALNANISFSGSYGILDSYNFESLENIYILIGLDSWRKNPNQDGFELIKSENNFLKKYLLNLKKNMNYRKLYYIGSILLFAEKKVVIKNDYLEREDRELKIENFKKINKKKTLYLEKILKFCSVKKINCKLFHTPIVNYHCQNARSQDYIKKVYDLLEQKNINFEKKLFCYDKKNFSDSMDHLNSHTKKKFSNYFAKQFMQLNLK